MLLDGKPIDFVKEWQYLGVTVVTVLSHSPQRSVNSLLASFRKPDELVLMHLLYTNFVPILCYAAEVVWFPSSELRACNIALNDAI